MRESSQAEYLTHPEGQIRPWRGPGPMDVLDILQGMIPEFNIVG